jgi:hypothetical protein
MRLAVSPWIIRDLTVTTNFQMVFVLLEALRGRRMSPRVENGINAVSVLLLASLSFYLIAGDITRGVSPLEKANQAQVQMLDKSPR